MCNDLDLEGPVHKGFGHQLLQLEAVAAGNALWKIAIENYRLFLKPALRVCIL